MRSGPPADLVPTVEPIQFAIFPYQPEQVVAGTGVDLRTQAATAINLPILSAAGRNPTVQIVILSGSANWTQTRERQSHQGVQTGAATPPSGGLVPGGGIAFYDEDLKVLVRGLGTLGKDAVEMQVFGAVPGSPVSAEGVVVEPVELVEEARQRLEGEIRKLAGRNPVMATLDAYCLDFLRQPPDMGTVFRVADQAIQQRFAPLTKVLQAGRRLYDQGLLNPDSDPEEYFHSIRQWALWAVQENLDQGSFGDAFLEHTRKNFEIASQPWTAEIEGLVRSLVPNRWQDIARILEEARSPSVSAQVGSE
jgi:hypothetical protein